MDKTSKIGVIQKITNFLLGFVLSFFVSALLYKIIDTVVPGQNASLSIFGLATFVIANMGLAIFILKKYEEDKTKRIVGIGIIFGLLAMTVLPMVFWMIATYLYQGVAN